MPRVRNSLILGLAWLLTACASLPVATNSSSFSFAEQFNQFKDDPVMLRLMLKEFPKGGDLHNHISGTPYAEEFLEWSSDRRLCIDIQAKAVVSPPCSTPDKYPAENLLHTNPKLYAETVAAMSVKNFIENVPVPEAGHKQFFDSFDKFFVVSKLATGHMLASAKQSAALDRVLYQELMFNPGAIDRTLTYANKADWTGDFDESFEKIEHLLPDIALEASLQTDEAETETKRILRCDQQPTPRACNVVNYYNNFGLRLFEPHQLFLQLAAGFELIESDPRFLAMSLVQPEDDPRTLKDYDLQMEMIRYLSNKYPSAKVTLHAGEVTLGLVPQTDLQANIEKAVMIAGSDRIGHGVDIAYETNSRQTLAYMAENNIAVEINLSSNDVILGVKGRDHPVNLYRAAGVPIVLSTDDLGVLRSDMTEQYVRAVTEQGFDYTDLKTASRNSLKYAFLPDEEKSELQTKLEDAFIEFEINMAKYLTSLSVQSDPRDYQKGR